MTGVKPQRSGGVNGSHLGVTHPPLPFRGGGEDPPDSPEGQIKKSATPSKMPPWLERMLVAQGKLDVDGYAIKARVRYCRRCGAVTIRGLDSPVAGVPVDLDATTLDNDLEVLALVEGRKTHRVRWLGKAYEIMRPRSEVEIRREPASEVRDVHAVHRCGAVLGSLAAEHGFSRPRTQTTTDPGF